ncbi:MAG: S41 family peptidase [Candidatus Pacebacteria bacterium]|nr:S41 family peptidase [Candidatus Paceibacterota bacterium]MBP9715594.1 S41 family peptidase [Candidatus Paceibacterota bacterium]
MVQINFKQKYLFIATSVILIVGVFAGGYFLGNKNQPEPVPIINITNSTDSTVSTNADFAPFWKVWQKINEKSIYANKKTDQEKVWGAVQGLASSLGDPYTVFFPPEESKLFNDSIHGSFGGIGAEISIKDKILTIVAPLKDSPAFRAGLKSGDKILKIGKTDTTDMTVDKAISLIRGEKGTVVNLNIYRKGEKTSRDISITRDTIEIPTIDTEARDDGVFVISLYSFSENSAELFRKALLDFSKTGYNKLVVDLRGNPGGYLDSAVNISNWFLDAGKIIVTEDYGDKRKSDVIKSRGPRVFTDQLKLVILVDGGSASASEILAGALQQNGLATLVGEKTFGKGSVQEVIDITDDTSLKVTVARWLTPNGDSISEKGLTPDHIVPITEKDLLDKKDPQLEKAVEILKGK